MTSMRAIAGGIWLAGLGARALGAGVGWWAMLPLVAAVACSASWASHGHGTARVGWHRFDRALLVASAMDLALCWGLFGAALLA